MKRIILILLFSFNCISAICQSKEDFNVDLIDNKETAIKIAEIIWQNLYGDEIYKYKPYKVKLINNNKWIIQGTVPKGLIGGYPYIEINKKDCRILKVIHMK